MTLLLSLLAAGLLLLLFEVLLPGGIAGLFGFGFIIAASVVCYQEYGLAWSLITFVLSCLVAVIILVGGIKVLPHTRIGQAFFHRGSNKSIGITPVDRESLVGKKGQAISILAPTGLVLIDGQSYEAHSQSGFIEKGTPVEVIEQTILHLIVIDKPETARSNNC